MTLAMCGNDSLPHILMFCVSLLFRFAVLERPSAPADFFRWMFPGGFFIDEGLFRPTPFEMQMTIMLNADSAASACGKTLAHFGRDWCVLRAPLIVAGTCNGLQSSDLRASASAPQLRAANDNQLAWPYLAFADDWYASC